MNVSDRGSPALWLGVTDDDLNISRLERFIDRVHMSNALLQRRRRFGRDL